MVSALAAWLVAGCSGTRPAAEVRERLEESTGTTVTSLDRTAVFVRTQPGLASSGRDYVYVAPIAVSRAGQRTFWLWVGAWSTVDRPYRNPAGSPLALGALQMVVDDQPMDLELQGAALHPAGINRSPYGTPVSTDQEYLAPVTRSQLERIGRAHSLRLVDRPPDGAARDWQPDEQAVAVLRRFAEAATTPMTGMATGGNR